jgi:NitT/TauT family transport system substrate-binding protein
MRRRDLLRGLGAVGTASALGLRARPAAADPPPETTRLRLIKSPSICWAPQYIADDLLRAEGFTDVTYPEMRTGAVSVKLAAGEADMSLNFVGPNIIRIEAGDPVVFLAGVHVGCFEVFGGERVRRIRDLKGKVAAVDSLNGATHVFFTSIAANVGIDPHDIRWVTPEPEGPQPAGARPPLPTEQSLRLFIDGKADAFLGFPPQPQELRARKIGHVLVNSATDRPWSQYFCCLMTASKDFVRNNPVATKRALRAVLKAADICALDPPRAARAIVDGGFTPRYEYALQVMQELPYGKWREYDPEDTVRFYALRLREAGMIKASPQKIIGQGTDWRFLNELKKELKG